LPKVAQPGLDAEPPDPLKGAKGLLDKLPSGAAKPPGAGLEGLADKLSVPPDAAIPELDPAKSLDALAEALGKLPKP
jgi:hypothetical protein